MGDILTNQIKILTWQKILLERLFFLGKKKFLTKNL